jgi:hypothetical protein
MHVAVWFRRIYFACISGAKKGEQMPTNDKPDFALELEFGPCGLIANTMLV